MRAKNRGPYPRMLKIKIRSTVYYNGLYSLTIKVNYQINLTKTITVRVERRKTKTGSFIHKMGSFIHKTTRAEISLQVVNFAI